MYAVIGDSGQDKCLAADVGRHLVGCAHKFLLHYSWPASWATTSGLFRYNVVPKHRDFWHWAYLPFKFPEPEVTLVLRDRRLCRNDIGNGHGLPAWHGIDPDLNISGLHVSTVQFCICDCPCRGLAIHESPPSILRRSCLGLCIYMYIYIYMHIYVYIHIHIYIYTYIHIK